MTYYLRYDGDQAVLLRHGKGEHDVMLLTSDDVEPELWELLLRGAGLDGETGKSAADLERVHAQAAEARDEYRRLYRQANERTDKLEAQRDDYHARLRTLQNVVDDALRASVPVWNEGWTR